MLSSVAFSLQCKREHVARAQAVYRTRSQHVGSVQKPNAMQGFTANEPRCKGQMGSGLWDQIKFPKGLTGEVLSQKGEQTLTILYQCYEYIIFSSSPKKTQL